MNVSFSCRSGFELYKITAKGGNALQMATEAVEAPTWQ
jgi:hypothetical protein